MKRNAVNIAIVLSFLLHFVLALLIWFGPKADFTTQNKTKNMEVLLIDPATMTKKSDHLDTPKGQVVDQSEKAINDQVPEDAKLLSRHNQTVEKQTRAPLSGKFVNSQTTGGKPQEEIHVAQPRQAKNQTKLENKVAPKVVPKADLKHLVTNAKGERILPSLKDLKPDFHPVYHPYVDEDTTRGGGAEASASDDHLKDVPVGMQTLLSTREFIYYTYYARIKDKLRQYWEPKIKEKMERILRQGRTIASTNDKITRIVIILDKTGTLVHVQVVGGSGLIDLDDAAVEAFKAAAPFPNPPKGIVEPDGTIHIRWDFILEA